MAIQRVGAPTLDCRAALAMTNKIVEIKEITSKIEWEEFLAQCTEKTFLQAWNWGEFQISLGKKIWRFGIDEDGQLVSVALVIKMTAKRGSFLLIPHGPVVRLTTVNLKNILMGITEKLLEKLKELAKTEKVDFIRISPIWQRTAENEKIFKDLKFRLRPLHTHPESSWKLNIEAPEEVLFDGMRKTTKYLIRQAQKNKDLEIVQSFDMADVETFNAMHLEVVKHQKFIPFSLEYFKKEFSAFASDSQIALFLAKYQGKVIGASYVIFWPARRSLGEGGSGQAFYHHAALLPEYKKIPASYLLQWEAIKEAKKRGCKIYDFWGYSDPIKYPKHPYSGPTLFKMGFKLYNRNRA